MPRHFARDVFARGAYHRINERVIGSNGERLSNKTCDWDGQERKTLYAFIWESDTDRCPPRHGGLKYFCNMTCYKEYYS